MTILLFASLVVNVGLSGSAADAALVTLGFFLGSLGWWLTLVAVVARLRGRLTGRTWHAVSVVSGALIAIYGVIAIVAVVRG
jgi:hypothetical protein